MSADGADDTPEATDTALARLAELKAAGARARADGETRSKMAAAALALVRLRPPVSDTPGIMMSPPSIESDQ